MVRRAIVILVLALVASACGAGRGLRSEPTLDPAHRLGAGSTSSTMHLVSAAIVSGFPLSLTSDGRTIWASTDGAASANLQIIDAATGRDGPSLGTYTSTIDITQLDYSPGTLWILTESSGERAKLETLPSRARNGGGLVSSSTTLPRLAATFPKQTRIVGVTRSAIWLLGPNGGGFMLWRRDLRTAQLRAFPLTSKGRPDAAVSKGRVLVLRKVGRFSEVIETRDTRGHIIATTSRLEIPGAVQPSAFAACGTSVVGWSRADGGANLFVVETKSSRVRSTRLSSFAFDARVLATAVDPHCRQIWISLLGSTQDLVARYRMASLVSSGKLAGFEAYALLWSHGGLWAADATHDAVVRFQ
jgi:hypothetical protein